MDTRIFTEPQQGASYDQLLAVARAAESGGFSAFFRSDHFLKMGSADGLPGPTDSWVTLAGLARDTRSIRLGTLVTSATFRHAGVLAVTVAQVDQMSGGRVELGLGAGWYEDEHRAHAVPFPSLAERFDIFEDQLEILTGMWGTPVGQTYTHVGARLSVTDSPGLPKPAQDRLPIIVGGRGPQRTPRLAATYADEFNVPFAPVDDLVELYSNVRATCERQDRDPASLTMSVALVVCCAEDEAELARRAARIGREVDELRANGVAGTPQECVDKLADYADIGAERVYLQFLDLDDLDQIELLSSAVLPEVQKMT